MRPSWVRRCRSHTPFLTNALYTVNVPAPPPQAGFPLPRVHVRVVSSTVSSTRGSSVMIRTPRAEPAAPWMGVSIGLARKKLKASYAATSVATCVSARPSGQPAALLQVCAALGHTSAAWQPHPVAREVRKSGSVPSQQCTGDTWHAPSQKALPEPHCPGALGPCQTIRQPSSQGEPPDSKMEEKVLGQEAKIRQASKMNQWKQTGGGKRPNIQEWQVTG